MYNQSLISMGRVVTKHGFDVIVLEDGEGGYVAYVPRLPGCQTQGETLDEVVRNAKEAIELYLETLSGEELSELLGSRVVGIYWVEVENRDRPST